MWERRSFRLVALQFFAFRLKFLGKSRALESLEGKISLEDRNFLPRKTFSLECYENVLLNLSTGSLKTTTYKN